MVQKFGELEKDFVKELSSIGSGNASTLLSKEIGAEIKLVTPKYNTVSIDQFDKSIKMPKGMAICVFAKFESDILGAVMLILDERSAFVMADLLQKKKMGTTKWLSKEDQDALKNLGHLLLKSYLNAIAPFLASEATENEMRIFSTIGEAVLDIATLGASKSDSFIILQNDFIAEGSSRVEGKFTYIMRAGKKKLQRIATRAMMKSEPRVVKQRNRKN